MRDETIDIGDVVLVDDNDRLAADVLEIEDDRALVAYHNERDPDEWVELDRLVLA